MAKPNALQKYYLFLLWFFRVFVALIAVAALAITATDVPVFIRDRNAREIVITVGFAVLIAVLGFGLSLLVGEILKRYKAHIATQMDWDHF